MKKQFAGAQLEVEYLSIPEKSKGEKNPPFINSARVGIPEELLPELVEFLEKRGVFVGTIRGLSDEV